jgi:hypothetical protein
MYPFPYNAIPKMSNAGSVHNLERPLNFQILEINKKQVL